MSIDFGVESWFVVGCFIADEYFFVGECFYEGGIERVEEWIGWFDWMRGWLGIGRSVLRARMRAPVLGVLLFCCHKCHSGWNWKYFIIPKTTYRFMENNVSFYRKQRVVLWKVTGCFGLEVERLFWGWCFGKFLGWSSSVKVWQCGMLFMKSM